MRIVVYDMPGSAPNCQMPVCLQYVKDQYPEARGTKRKVNALLLKNL